MKTFKARVIGTGQRIYVEHVANVNNVPYFVNTSNPSKVYTEYELLISKD